MGSVLIGPYQAIDRAQFCMADRKKARFCIAMGENELAAKVVELKNLANGEQSQTPMAEIIPQLRQLLGP
jgi:histidyl-tRNA synthetase